MKNYTKHKVTEERYLYLKPILDGMKGVKLTDAHTPYLNSLEVSKVTTRRIISSNNYADYYSLVKKPSVAKTYKPTLSKELTNGSSSAVKHPMQLTPEQEAISMIMDNQKAIIVMLTEVLKIVVRIKPKFLIKGE